MMYILLVKLPFYERSKWNQANLHKNAYGKNEIWLRTKLKYFTLDTENAIVILYIANA